MNIRAGRSNHRAGTAVLYVFDAQKRDTGSKGVEMTIDDIAAVLDGKVLFKEEGEDREVGFVVASDLMSDVLLVDKDDILLLTSLASDQALRTAQIVGAMGVVVHNNKPLPASMKDVAKRLGISLVTAPCAKYESCIRIHEALEKAKRGA